MEELFPIYQELKAKYIREILVLYSVIPDFYIKTKLLFFHWLSCILKKCLQLITTVFVAEREKLKVSATEKSETLLSVSEERSENDFSRFEEAGVNLGCPEPTLCSDKGEADPELCQVASCPDEWPS
ncbi:jg8047 [Pararge aegeria aegeria]|uniref:Jg8047 protein n=1 Tax=Pararge aegeria aegeria TaxID=348720 RepID=A0A8S4QHW8_9NEOP|nr:jg8047 [Pararge aegeria aegeria]